MYRSVKDASKNQHNMSFDGVPKHVHVAVYFPCIRFTLYNIMYTVCVCACA